ncbi:MAG: MerR family transcriptional regulator [Hyphomicrobium sp.]|nr:MAG: MerR family transcriptional regulator [Hyphomicrobium sp.]PPC98530.1 MAG: MerR family transcriptional regulator [Hyphomicrobium sp.]
MSKSAEAFRTIGEVASELDVPKHVLRFWEGKFPQIRPMKRGGGRRYYRPEDMELLRGIRHLLHAEGYTIKGVQKILREQGIDQVKQASRAALALAAGDGEKRKRGRKPLSEPARKAEAESKPSSKQTSQSLDETASLKPEDVIASAVKELRLIRQILLSKEKSTTDGQTPSARRTREDRA